MQFVRGRIMWFCQFSGYGLRKNDRANMKRDNADKKESVPG